MKDTTSQQKPDPVAPRPTRAGEPEGGIQLSLGSSAVWNQRMLATLERGITGGKWYSLIDKVWEIGNLRMAAWSVIRKDGSAGVDGESCKALEAHLEEVIAGLSRQLREDRYQPQPVKRVWIDKLGSKEKRPLGVPVIRDRVVQTALLYVLEPIFERDFAEHSYGFRPGRSAQTAIARVEDLLREGYTWIVDADVKSYFDTIPQDRLLAAVAQKVSDGRVLGLLEKYLKQGVMETAKEWKPTEQGTPQGAVISPLLANIYLDRLDQELRARGIEVTRFADDFITQSRTEAEAMSVLEVVKQVVSELGLTLHPQKTRIVEASQPGGFEFLGWHFERGYKWPREKSEKRFKETIRQQTKRTPGKSTTEIIGALNRRTRGWCRYFCGANGDVYDRLDRWIRMRLRSIQRKWDRRKGRGRGRDHNRYPNAYWAELGLLSLKALGRAKPASPA